MTIAAVMSKTEVVPDEIQHDFPIACRLLALRLATTSTLPLSVLRKGAPAISSLRRDLVAALPGAAPRLASELTNGGTGRLAKLMSRSLTRYLMRRNQYLQLPRNWDGTTEHLYAEFLEEFAAGAADIHKATQALVDHQRRLRALLDARDPGGLCQDEPVCANYSPALQLRLLRLDPGHMPGPILDIGCGEQGSLVRYLRSLGRADAWGIDALCETGGPLIRGSWLEMQPAPAKFGTIIAHQSISLHLMRAHLEGTHDQAEKLVRAFRGILAALTPGGAFHYAPAIPFLEELLPRYRWSVRRYPIALPTGPSVFEASRVTALSASSGTRASHHDR